MGTVKFYVICTKVDEAKLRSIMIKTGGVSDRYCIQHYFTTNIRDQATKILTMT